MKMQTFLTLLPAVIAVLTILITKRAAIALLSACITGVVILASGNLFTAADSLITKHAYNALKGPWHIGPILFTLILGSFAQVLEKSGGFGKLFNKTLNTNKKKAQKQTLLTVYATGLLCFFDGLANAMLLGRVARPITDSLKLPRQLLAYVIDSTSSAVACIAFISTWIGAQLSYIQEGIQTLPPEHQVSPVSLYFQSIQANPYCWLALLMVFLTVSFSWWIGPMKKYVDSSSFESTPKPPIFSNSSIYSVLIPIGSLLITIPGCIYFMQGGDQYSWSKAFQSNFVPHAMVAGASSSLFIATICFPKARRRELLKHIKDGAITMLPALVILLLAWTLGSIFTDLKLNEHIASWLDNSITLNWFPLAVFLVGSAMSFISGSSWGTMAILMPIALPSAINLGVSESPELLLTHLSYVVGAVFGGAVFGDHCSPFSDTTIVSSISSGCTASSHITTQLPYASICCIMAIFSYTLIAIGMLPILTIFLSASLLVAIVLITKRYI